MAVVILTIDGLSSCAGIMTAFRDFYHWDLALFDSHGGSLLGFGMSTAVTRVFQ
jgi:hypothetical protein